MKFLSHSGISRRSTGGHGMVSRSSTSSGGHDFRFPAFANNGNSDFQPFRADQRSSESHRDFVFPHSRPSPVMISHNSDVGSFYGSPIQTRNRVIQIDIGKWNEDMPNHQVGVFQYDFGFLVAPINTNDILHIPLDTPYASFIM